MSPWTKGSSTCLYAATISKALFDLARGLDIRVDVAKTGRMSGPGERSADALSKNDQKRAWEDIGNVGKEVKRKVPKVIEEWIRDIRQVELRRGVRQSMEEGKLAVQVMKKRLAREQHMKARKRKRGKEQEHAA